MTIFIFAMLILKIVHRALKVIGEIPSEVMKWIGGGHHAFGDDPHDEGNKQVNAIMAHVKTAAGMGAGKPPGPPGKPPGAKPAADVDAAGKGERGLQNVKNQTTI